MDKLVTQTEAARHAKCSVQYINKLIRLGKIKRYDNRRVDLSEVLSHKFGFSVKDSTAMPLVEIKRRREIIALKLSEIELSELRGSFVSIKEVDELMDEIKAILNKELFLFAETAAKKAANIDNVAEINSILFNEINAALAKIQKEYT
jgi:hypothetical protein